MKIGWVIDDENYNHSCTLARVLRPHQQLQSWGVDSRLLGPGAPLSALFECDVLIFHRALKRLSAVANRDIAIGFDLADDLLSHEYAALPVDFLVTDSLPNTRFYLTRDTHYWPHGFPDQTAPSARRAADSVTRFVYCGAPENVHCLIGAPLDALEAVGAKTRIVLRIITNLASQENKETWLAKLPTINPKNFSVEWMQFEQASHETLMKECDVGFFPQSIDKERWWKKSIYKPTHAASLGLPSISSPTEEASMSFLDGKNALLAHSADEWIRAVDLMTKPDDRKRLQDGAIDLYRARFTIEIATQQILAIAKYQQRRARTRRFKGLRRLLLRSFLFSERILNALQKRSAR